jgi:hypothetical protein
MSTHGYRQVLEEHLAQVDGELADRRRAAAPSGERPGFGKRAGDYVAQVVEDRTNNQLAESLAVTATSIRRALTLIDEGRFGCANPAVNPSAKTDSRPCPGRCSACGVSQPTSTGTGPRRPAPPDPVS